MSNILVTGATGPFGKATIDFLLQKGIPASHIFAFVRDVVKAEELKSKGVTLKRGNYDDYPSLVEAFTGMDKVLLVSGNDVVNRSQQHENAVNAAKEASVKHVVYTSFERRNETETSPIAMVAKAHVETEQNLKASGMAYTILRNNIYMDMLPVFFGEKVLETGIFLPAGEGKPSFALRSEMAEAAAVILANEGHENKEYTFANSENTSFQEMADILSKLSGKKVTYSSPSPAVYIDTLSKAGVPAEYAGMYAGFAKAMEQGEFTVTHSNLDALLGRKPVSVKEFLTQVYSPKN